MNSFHLFEKEDLYLKDYDLETIYRNLKNNEDDNILKIYDQQNVHIGWLLTPCIYINKNDFKIYDPYWDFKFDKSDGKIILKKYNFKYDCDLIPSLDVDDVNAYDNDGEPEECFSHIEDRVGHWMHKSYPDIPFLVILRCIYESKPYYVYDGKYYFDNDIEMYKLKSLDDFKTPLSEIYVTVYINKID